LVNIDNEEIAGNQRKHFWSKSGFSIYPNPTTGNLTIELTNNTSTVATVIEVYGMLGERIIREEFSGQSKLEISLALQPPGIYILRVIAGKETVTVKVIRQ
jgi:hypothetical protein